MNNNVIDITRNIILKLRKGDRRAFEELIRNFSDKIYFSCKRMALDDEEAREVCQEVFIKIWEVRETIDTEKSVNGFIFTITKNIILKKIRRRAYSTVLEKYWSVTYSTTTRNTEEYLDLKELEELTREFIEKLPGKQRKIMMLRINEDLNNDDIAKQLNLSKRTVENQIYRALKKLRKYLTQ